jgi:hypothetical protein
MPSRPRKRLKKRRAERKIKMTARYHLPSPPVNLRQPLPIRGLETGQTVKLRHRDCRLLRQHRWHRLHPQNFPRRHCLIHYLVQRAHEPVRLPQRGHGGRDHLDLALGKVRGDEGMVRLVAQGIRVGGKRKSAIQRAAYVLLLKPKHSIPQQLLQVGIVFHQFQADEIAVAGFFQCHNRSGKTPYATSSHHTNKKYSHSPATACFVAFSRCH